MFNVSELFGFNNDFIQMAGTAFDNLDQPSFMDYFEALGDIDYDTEELTLDAMMMLTGCAIGAMYMKALMDEFIDDKTRAKVLEVGSEESNKVYEDAMNTIWKGIDENMVHYKQS